MMDTVIDLISEDDFVTLFNPLETTSNGEYMVQQYDQAKSLASDMGVGEKHIWTIVEGAEDDCLYAVAGFHVVNRLGYMVTEKPWVSGDEEAVWYTCEEEEEAEW